MLSLIAETLTLLVFMIYVILSGIIRSFIPMSLLPKKDISKDTVLVTGAGSGIGRALAISFAKLGCRVVLWDINEEGNKETAAEIKKFGGQAHVYTVDLSNRADIYKVADQVLAEVGNVDILVNNAGIGQIQTITQCPEQITEQTLKVNLMAHFWTTKAFLPGMLERDHGHIVGLASVIGLVGSPIGAAYATSKSAVIGFLESLNLELRTMQKSIGTTVVCPYIVNTPMLAGVKIVPRYPWLLPLLEPECVASKTIQAIQTDQRVLYMPRFIYFIMALKGFIPTTALNILLHKLAFWGF